MKKRRVKVIATIVVLILGGISIYKTYPDNVFAVRILLNLDRDKIRAYQQYRICEFAKYHNYDTSWIATRDAFYNNQRECE